MAPTFRFECATPNRLVVSEEVDEVVAPGSEGYFGVWAGHAPFLTTLGVGELGYRKGREERILAVNGGFAEVSANKVIILTETAEHPEEIDVSRAREARARAEARLAGKTKEDADFTRAQAALSRALTRIRVASRR